MFNSQRYLILFLAFIALLGVGCRGENPQGQSNDVIPNKRIELVTKSEGDSQPFFRAAVTFKKDGEYAKLPDSPEELKKVIKVKTAGKKGTGEPPFYVSFDSQTVGEATQTSASRDIMVLFDVSGSMTRKDIQPSRFVAAQQAATNLLNTLSPNYRVAVAPFESAGVKAKIESAEFKSPKDAINSINSLPQPKGNTALYSAIDFAIDELKKRKIENNSQFQSLIVLTDGRNDVTSSGSPNDRDLLDGESGFQKVVRKIRESNLSVFTIGIGKSRQESDDDMAFDEDKLKELAYHKSEIRYFKADNLGDLSTRFEFVRASVSRVVNITFCTQDKNLYDLRSLKFDIAYNSPRGQLRGQIPWVCRNSITGCIPKKSGVLSREENLAMGSSCGSQNTSAWQPLLWLFGQLALFSGGIAALWMFVPTLIWPSIPLPSLPSRGKQKASPPPKPSPRSRSAESGQAEQPTPSKPRQRFEETKIYDNPGGRKN